MADANRGGKESTYRRNNKREKNTKNTLINFYIQVPTILTYFIAFLLNYPLDLITPFYFFVYKCDFFLPEVC